MLAHRGVGLPGPVELDQQEEWRLTLRDRLHRVVLRSQAVRQSGEFPAEVEQQLEPLPLRDRREVVDDAGEGLGQVVGDGRAHRDGTSPGASPVTMGTRTAFPHSVHEPS